MSLSISILLSICDEVHDGNESTLVTDGHRNTTFLGLQFRLDSFFIKVLVNHYVSLFPTVVHSAN